MTSLVHDPNGYRKLLEGLITQVITVNIRNRDTIKTFIQSTYSFLLIAKGRVISTALFKLHFDATFFVSGSLSIARRERYNSLPATRCKFSKSKYM